MRALALATVLLGVSAAPAAAQIQPPSLTADTTFAFQGISQYDQNPGIVADVALAAAVDADRGRSYAAGYSGTTALVVARRADGSLDTSFGGEGWLFVPSGRASAVTDLVVLPDGRLRLLVREDRASSGPPAYDVSVYGLRADGSDDPDFTTVHFDAGAANDYPNALALGPDGRIAVAGRTGNDSFVRVDGVTTVIDRAPSAVDEAVDVTWGGAGPVLAIKTPTGAVVRAVGGFDTEVTVPGATSVEPRALLAYGGMFWVTGTTVVAGDSDAFLARLDGAGSGFETRRFDMRGSVFSPGQQIIGRGLNLAVVPGDPDTLVVSGASEVDRGPQWALAAFNGLEGALSTLAYTDLVLPVVGHTGTAAGLAGSAGAVVAAGALLDGSTTDNSLGMARVLIDAEKRCDLALAIVSPVELLMRGTAASDVTLRVTNNGRRPCSGAINIPAPWGLAGGNADVGRLLPGESTTRTLSLGYGAALPNDATLELTLSAVGDSALGDNAVRLRAVFSFCDLALSVLEAPPVIGTEGSRRFAFTVRNVGTAPCRAAQVITRAPGIRSGTVLPYTVLPGKSVEDEIAVGVLRGLKTGTRAPLTFRVVDLADVAAANDVASATPVVVRPGDTNARTPLRGISFSGRASRGAAVGVSARTLRVRRVQISIRRLGSECRWLSSADGDLRTVDENAAGKCDDAVWVTVKGTERWSLRLAERLPKGRYELRTRAVLANGLAEGRFTRGDKNLIRFRVR
ncbi:hypothetical protein OJ998_06800 [Solirubrobacter taibaiensis]|nr:hypothetical protein [Solirubrobacter taibaiensis]